MIIFGWGKRTFKSYRQTGPVRCPRCNNIRPFQYKKATTWFTLFFIPVIPYQMVYYKECPICKAGMKVTKEEAMGTGGVEEDHRTEVQKNYFREIEEAKKNQASNERESLEE